jgi:hypothetical protein
MRVIIAGSREFNDYELLKTKCNEIIKEEKVEILSGTARGADTLGEKYCIENGHLLRKYPADWDRYGKSAGYKRNQLMADNADTLIAFWDGNSRGTRNMIDISRKKKLKVFIISV